MRWYENFLIAPNKISGTLFFDVNTNGIFDPSELGMNAGNVLLQPTGVYSYPNSAGEYVFSEGVGAFTLQSQGVQTMGIKNIVFLLVMMVAFGHALRPHPSP